MKKALGHMIGGKAVASDNIPVGVWKHLGETGVTLLRNLFHEIIRAGNWRFGDGRCEDWCDAS